jgi:hypothetical protein
VGALGGPMLLLARQAGRAGALRDARGGPHGRAVPEHGGDLGGVSDRGQAEGGPASVHGLAPQHVLQALPFPRGEILQETVVSGEKVCPR